MKARSVLSYILASIVLFAAPSAFAADYVYQFRGPVTSCVSNSSGCEPTEEIVLELFLDQAYYTPGTNINESNLNDPRAHHKFSYYIELNYPPYPPAATGKHIIWSYGSATTGNSSLAFALRTVGLPALLGGWSTTSAVDFSAGSAMLPNRTISLGFVSTATGWSIQSSEMNATTIKYTHYSGREGRWIRIK
jgi:hypothetical protein